MDQKDTQRLNTGTLEFWYNQWRDSITEESETVARGHSTQDFWDTMSRDYDKNFDEEAKRRIEGLIDSLEKRGLFSSGMRVLDIGCGTGRLAIAMAGRGAEITALDFSQGMLDKLEENCPGKLERQITAVRDDWTALDIEQKGWKSAFDLVVAQMTPALRKPEGLEKLIAASRENCYLKAWAEKRRSMILDDIWRMFAKEEPTRSQAPFLFMLNALFACGYYPDIEFQSVEWDREQSIDDLQEQYISYATGMFDTDETEIRHRIAGYLEKKADNGIIRDKTNGKTVQMMWKLI